MENNETINKPPGTGGLPLMTVFIGVLALHVLVIGGMTVYYMVRGSNADADLIADKTHKSVKVVPDSTSISEGQLPDADKNATSATASAAGTPLTIPAPPPEASQPPPATTPSTVVASGAETPTPESTAPVTETASTTIVATPAPETTAGAPSGPVQTGPVITPPSTPAPASTSTSASLAATPDSPAAADAAPVTGTPTAGTPYTVKSHDSLARIAHRHHITVAKLKAANDLKTDALHIGQKLMIPGKSLTTATTSSSLATLREPDTTLLGDSNPEPAKPTTTHTHKIASTTATGGHHIYTVVKGDTLTKIAHKFRTTTAAIVAANNAMDASKLKIGQKLRIPSSESRSATAEPPPPPAAQPTPPDQTEEKTTTSAQLANFLP